MLFIKKFVLSKEENKTQHLFSYIQTARKYSLSFKTDPLNITFDHFGILIFFKAMGFEFNCSYILQGHTFISTLWL